MKNFNNSKKSNNRPEFPDDYLKGGYYKTVDGKILLKKEYIVTYPDKIAETLSCGVGEKNKRTQIRKYYGFTIRLKELLNNSEKDFEEIEAELNRMRYFAENACNSNKVTKFFVDFINKNLDYIHREEDFKAFAKHFEAVVAYLPKERN